MFTQLGPLAFRHGWVAQRAEHRLPALLPRHGFGDGCVRNMVMGVSWRVVGNKREGGSGEKAPLAHLAALSSVATPTTKRTLPFPVQYTHTITHTHTKKKKQGTTSSSSGWRAWS